MNRKIFCNWFFILGSLFFLGFSLAACQKESREQGTALRFGISFQELVSLYGIASCL